MQAPGADHICALGFIPGDRPGQARRSGADRGTPPGSQLQGGARICACICARSPAVPPGAGESQIWLVFLRKFSPSDWAPFPAALQGTGGDACGQSAFTQTHLFTKLETRLSLINQFSY